MAQRNNLARRRRCFRQVVFARILPTALQQTAELGDQLAQHYGALHLAIRAVQEPYMKMQSELIDNARVHLQSCPELRGDIVELHRIGAIPKYRGPTPGEFRVRGFPRNPAEQEYILGKLWSYAREGKLFICHDIIIPVNNPYMVSTSTDVAKKLPDRAISTEKE